MKKIYDFIRLPIICTILFTGIVNGQETNPCKTGGQTCYFGIELNNILCGYSIEEYCNGTWNGKKVRYEYSDVTLKMSLLGEDMDAGFKILYIIDPSTERAVRIEVSVINGQSVVKSVTTIDGDSAYFSSPTSGVKKTIHVRKDLVIASQTRYPHLFNDFIKNRNSEKKYMVYEPVKGEITEKGYTRKSDENIVLSDSSFQTLVLEETDFSTGVRTMLWLNKANGFNVKTLVAGRKIYFADKSVTSRITFANLDDELFARAGEKIPDIMNLSWLRVKAQINSYGEVITVKSLNFPDRNLKAL